MTFNTKLDDSNDGDDEDIPKVPGGDDQESGFRT